MRLLMILLVACVAFSACEANALTDMLKKFGAGVKSKADGIKNDLKEVVPALGGVAKDSFKSLLGQTGQAIMGAFINSFKGFNLGEILFGKLGKRELSHIQEASAGVEEFISKLVDRAHKVMGEIFHKTFTKFANIIQSLVEFRPEENVQAQLEQIHGEHQIAVRGVFGDLLNSGIDAVKRMYYNLKAKLFGSGEPKVSDPVMVGRRGLLRDAWNNFMGKVQSLKEKIIPQYEKATEVTTHLAAALGHYGGKMVEQAKQKIATKMHETLGYLKGSLDQHLTNAKNTFEAVKQELSDVVQHVMSGN